METSTLLINQKPISTYYVFNVINNKVGFQVSVLADNKIQFLNCSCGAENSNCIHVEKLFSGDKKALKKTEFEAQKKLIASLITSQDGKNFLNKFAPNKNKKMTLIVRMKNILLKSLISSKLRQWLISNE